ncbi:hypothetical protein [Clostridium chrysemydis]|uniref:hypothetical protein n=1 Tax=Clostridium chrysemydis TaxID=2665504 RepID=UPI0018845A95|nr:hypothetical protein [Clostridium chrysemydis]
MKEAKARKRNIIYLILVSIIVILLGVSVYNYKEKIKAQKIIFQTGIESIEGLEEIYKFYESYQGKLSLNDKKRIQTYIGFLASNIERGSYVSKISELENTNLKDSLESVIDINDKNVTFKAIKTLTSLDSLLKDIESREKKCTKVLCSTEDDDKKIIGYIQELSSFNK